MKLKLKTLLLTLTIFLSGCHSITVKTDPLPLPDPLVIPANLKILSTEWDCLATVHADKHKEAIRRSKCGAYIKLYKRSTLKSTRNQTLRGIIKSTHDKD